jgi:hypothetical protein
MRGLVDVAQSFAPDGCRGRVGDGKAVLTGSCPTVDADADVAAAAEPASASPGNVKAATARHAPTVAYSLKRNVNSPEYVIRDADPVEPSDTREQEPKNPRTPAGGQKEG